MPFKKGLTPWNKGLTKITDKRVRQYANKKIGVKRPPFSDTWKKNISKSQIGKKHSPESIKKMRNIVQTQYDNGRIGYFKGKKFSKDHARKISEALKGRKFSKQHRINLSKVMQGRKIVYFGERHHNWKNTPSYKALHQWVYRWKGRPKQCIKCGHTEDVEWANEDHKYKRDLNDYLALCPKCHAQYDISKKLRSVLVTR